MLKMWSRFLDPSKAKGSARVRARGARVRA